jgi:cell shape-determining protein MreC
VGLSDIISQVGTLLPQLAGFIARFDNTVAETGVNVITDAAGSMSLDVPNSMSPKEVTEITEKLGVIDRLINTRGDTINNLLQKGLELSRLEANNSEQTSQLHDQIQEFRRLNSLYKH